MPLSAFSYSLKRHKMHKKGEACERYEPLRGTYFSNAHLVCDHGELGTMIQSQQQRVKRCFHPESRLQGPTCGQRWMEHKCPKEPFPRVRILDIFFGGGFPGDSDGKESTCNVGDLGSAPHWGRSHRERNGFPLQYSCLENSMGRGVWQTTVHEVSKSQTGLTNYIIYIF